MTTNTHQAEYDDEIDLVELILNLWKEKLTIIISTAIVTALGLIYALTSTPVYEATLQIESPTASQLIALNNTQIIGVNPNSAFSSFLNILESAIHKKRLIEEEKPLLSRLLNKPEADITLESTNLDELYKVNYPNLKKQKNSLEPDIYTLSTEGSDRLIIAQLLNNTIKLAAAQVIEKWRKEFDSIKTATSQKITTDFTLLSQDIKERRENTITRLTEDTELKTKKIQDQLTARKSYVLDNRKDRIIELEEALKIAIVLNISQPYTLSRMATQSSSKQVEVNTEMRNQQDPLYLRGSKLLTAEVESLVKLPQTTFLDSTIIELQNELQQLKNNREIEILKARKNEVAFDDTLQGYQEQLRKLSETQFPNLLISFQNSTANSPTQPIKPKRTLIIAISICLGGMIGLFVAIGRIVYKNLRKKST
jgi:LPS O-antigen subunit length determinant protein (WzzB/FepE family)